VSKGGLGAKLGGALADGPLAASSVNSGSMLLEADNPREDAAVVPVLGPGPRGLPTALAVPAAPNPTLFGLAA